MAISNLNPLSGVPISRSRGGVVFFFALAAVSLRTGSCGAQQTQVPFQAGSRSNVEVRHTPGAQVWPSKVGRVTNAVGGGRIPPTIEKTANGVKATLNPSWFAKATREVSASGKVSISCDDDGDIHPGHSHSKKVASKKPATALKKTSRTTHKSR